MALNALFGGLGAVNSIVGAMGASARRKAAEEARAQALADASAELNRQHNELLTNNLQSLRASTGNVGDAIRGLGSNLGAASANAGVYNSTANQGSLNQFASQGASSLADLAARNFASESQQQHDAQSNLLNQRLGIANSSVAQSIADEGSAFNGLNAGLGALSNYLGQKGVSNPTARGDQTIASTPLDSSMSPSPDYNGPTRAATIQQPSLLGNSNLGTPSGLQSYIQPMTGQSPYALGMSPRVNGLTLNGTQGSKSFGTSYRPLFSGGGLVP